MSMDEIKLACEIKKLSRAINQNLERILSEKIDEQENNQKISGVTYMQARVITYLSRNSDRAIYQRDLEREFEIRGPSVTSLLQGMEKNDLIVRSRVSHDARLKRLTLTERAVQIDKILQECVIQHEAELRAGLAECELQTLIALMKKVGENLI